MHVVFYTVVHFVQQHLFLGEEAANLLLVGFSFDDSTEPFGNSVYECPFLFYKGLPVYIQDFAGVVHAQLAGIPAVHFDCFRQIPFTVSESG